MMYQVTWGIAVEHQLAAIWIASTDRGAVTAASAWLEYHLSRTPLGLGEPRTSSVHRVAYRAPLGVEFQVIEDDKRVIVQGVFAAG